MKKFAFLLATLACLFLFTTTKAQNVWFDIGIKGGYGTTFLYNKNIFNDNTYNNQINGAYGFGGKLGLNFGSSVGIGLDAMVHGNEQSFDYKYLGTNYNNTIEWNTLDVALLFRILGRGTFLELGPVYSRVNSVSQMDTNPLFMNLDDASEYYNDSYYSLAFGFGGFVLGTGSFGVELGFRLRYALGDFVSEAGQNPGLVYNSFPNPIREEAYDNYTKTSPISFMITIEANLGLGGFAKTACSEKAHWFWLQR